MIWYIIGFVLFMVIGGLKKPKHQPWRLLELNEEEF